MATTTATKRAPAEQSLFPVSVPRMPALRVPAEATVRPRSKSRVRLWAALVLVMLAVTGGGAAYWWQHLSPGLPSGIASGNGRVEADEIDIATKLGGRIAEIFADEGDTVKAGQVVARIDTADLEASLAKKTAEVQRLTSMLAGAGPDVDRLN